MDTSRHKLTILAFLLAITAAAGPRSGKRATYRQQSNKTANQPKTLSAEETSPYVIDQYVTTIRFENDGTSRRELRVRARVLSDEGARELSRLAFDYDRRTEQLEISGVEIHQASGGSIGLLPHAVADRPVAAVKDARAYDDARQKSVRVPGLKIGDALQYTMTLTVVKPPAPGNFWLEHNFLRDAPVSEQFFEISVPGNRHVKLKTRAGPESFTTTADTSRGTSRRIYRWTFSPEVRPPKPADNVEPDIQMSTFLNWEDLERWYQKQWEASDSADPALDARVADLTHDQPTTNEKLAALYTFVSQKIRTIELAPNAFGCRGLRAARVLAQGYGTPLDKHALFSALAKTIGLRAFPVLIGRPGETADGVPSPAQFNHIVTAIEGPGELVWLDTAPEVAPFSLLAASLRNRRGLAIRSVSGDVRGRPDSPVQWITTPADPPFPATQNVTVNGELNADGNLTARVQYAVRGDAELLLRVAFHRAPREQWKNVGQLLAISDGFRGEVTNVVASNPEDTRKAFEVEYQISQKDLAHWRNQKAGLQVPLPSLGLPDIPAQAEGHKQGGDGLDLGTPLKVTAVATISFPKGVTVRAPFPVGVKRDYAEYRSTYRNEGGQLKATRELRFLLRQLPSERIGDYAAFARAVRNDEAQQIALERATPMPIPAASAPAKRRE